MAGMTSTQRTPKPITVEDSHFGVVTATPTERGEAGWSYDVTADDGTKLGVVAKRMVTREREVPGKRYVASRWQSPGWQTQRAGSYHWFEVHSLQYGITRVARDARP